jgi:CBS domain-containing protein
MNKDFLQVSEVMTRRPVVIESGKTVTDAALLMKRYNIGSILVVDGKKVLGIVTTDDIVFRVTAEKKHSVSTIIDEVMSTKVVTISPTATVEQAMEELNMNDIRQLPVMQDDELVGFITLKDIIRIEPALMDLVTDRVRNEEDLRQKHIQKLSDQTVVDDDLFN